MKIVMIFIPLLVFFVVAKSHTVNLYSSLFHLADTNEKWLFDWNIIGKDAYKLLCFSKSHNNIDINRITLLHRVFRGSLNKKPHCIRLTVVLKKKLQKKNMPKSTDIKKSYLDTAANV